MERFRMSFLGRVSGLHLILLVILSVGVSMKSKVFLLGGMAAAFLWLLANSFLIHYLSKLVFEGGGADPRKRSRMYLVCLVKFPVLYLLGLWLLVLSPVSNEGILLSLTAYLAVGLGVLISRRLT